MLSRDGRSLLIRVSFFLGVGVAIVLLLPMRSTRSPAAWQGGPDKRPIHLFSFDDYSIPFKKNLFLTLAAARKYSGNPVLSPGPPGSPDSYRTQFYGSVIRVEKFRMWYSAGSGDDRVNSWRVAYAESDDGLHWTKPTLGLTVFNGNTKNNLVGMPPNLDFELLGPLVVQVLFEPDEHNPDRRYKMAMYGRYYDSEAVKEKRSNGHPTIYPMFSADGLNWKLASSPPKKGAFDETEAPFTIKEVFEIGGLYKFDDIYFVSGQETWPDIWLPDGKPAGRTMVTHWSGDFINWSDDKSFSFQRYGYRSVSESQQEAHEPGGVWNRGNVLIGLYGLWQGATVRSERHMDLGLLISNDGIRFREPIADHVFLKAGESGQWDRHGLIQGQGYENVGDETFIYYGTWDLTGRTVPSTASVGLATLPRDRFGYLSTRMAGPALLTTAPIARTRAEESLYFNVDGLGENSYLRVELIDRLGKPIAAYSGSQAATVRQSGFKTKVNWPGRSGLDFANNHFRIRVKFEGNSAHQIKFYAAYLE